MPHNEKTTERAHPEAASKRGDFGRGLEEHGGRDDDEEDRGDFAEGQTVHHVPPDALPGDFASGQEVSARTGHDEHRGDFAEGQELDHDAESPAGRH